MPKKRTTVAPIEITNPAILQSIEAYEKGKEKPTQFNIDLLNQLINSLPRT